MGGEDAGSGQRKRKGRGRKKLGELENAEVGAVELGTAAEGTGSKSCPSFQVRGRRSAWFDSQWEATRFESGSDLMSSVSWHERWAGGRLDGTEEEQSREATGGRLDVGSLGQRAPAGVMAGGLGTCPPTPSQQEQVSGVPRLSSAEANAGAWARNDGSLGWHGDSGDGGRRC